MIFVWLVLSFVMVCGGFSFFEWLGFVCVLCFGEVGLFVSFNTVNRKD